MKNIILIILSLFVLVGCSTSSLKLNKSDELVLKYSSENILFTNKVLDSKLLNFKDLFVTMYKLKDEDGRVLFYEDVRTAQEFEFNYGGLYTVMHIFDNRKKYDEVYRRNNLRLVQFKLDSSTYLNVLIQASDTQIYSYVYGFSNEEFLKIAQMVKVKDDDELGELKHEGIVLNDASKPLSNWNDKMVYFTPLITPLRGVYGR